MQLHYVLFLCLLFLPTFGHADSLVIYTDRGENFMADIIEDFEKNENITIQTYYGGGTLLEKIIREGKNSPADIVISTNAVVAESLGAADLLKKLPPRIINLENKDFSDSDKYWLGLSYRVRLVVMDKATDLPAPNSLWDLANPIYKGAICIRDGTHKYNLDLFSQMAAHQPKEIKKFLKELKANLARKPQGNDRDQVRGILAGVCKIAIVNNYYFDFKTKQTDMTWRGNEFLLNTTNANLAFKYNKKH